MQLVPTSQDNRGQQQIKEELVINALGIQHTRHGRQAQYQSYHHPREYRNHRLVHGLDLFALQHIAGEEGDDEENNEDEQGPAGVDFFRTGLAVVGVGIGVAGLAAREVVDGVGYEDETHRGWWVRRLSHRVEGGLRGSGRVGAALVAG